MNGSLIFRGDKMLEMTCVLMCLEFLKDFGSKEFVKSAKLEIDLISMISLRPNSENVS